MRDCHIAKRQRGETHEHIARRNGISVGSVAAALKMPFPGEWPTTKRQAAQNAAKLVGALSALQSQVDADVAADAPESEPDFIADLFAAQRDALDNEDVAAERQRLTSALSASETHDEMSALELEIARLDPVVAHYLDAGDTRVLALSAAGHSPLCLSRPEDLAELARLTTYGPELEQEPGESDADFARCIGARRYRAIELLTQALTLVVTEIQS